MTDHNGFSRRELLVAGAGAMLVAFQLRSSGAQAQIPTGSIPAYLLGAPTLGSDVDSWIVVHADNTVTVGICASAPFDRSWKATSMAPAPATSSSRREKPL